MIRGFKDRRTEQLFRTSKVRGLPPDLVERARRKLMALHAAHIVADLRNRLEALKGNREGQHSIRINDQWRICFRWVDGDGLMAMPMTSKSATITEVRNAAFA